MTRSSWTSLTIYPVARRPEDSLRRVEGLRHRRRVTAASGLAKAAFDSATTAIDSHRLSMRTFGTGEAAMIWAQSGLTES